MSERPVPCRPVVSGRSLGDYRLIEPLGRGSQGEVWKAVQFVPDLKLVALKVLHADQARRPARRIRFRREAEMGMRLVGASILAVEAFGEADGTMYMAMPLINGASLAEVIAQRRQSTSADPHSHTRRIKSWWDDLSEVEFHVAMVRVVSRMARALGEIHAQRVVHRDVKPSNILLDRADEGRVYLADFGLARDLDDASTRNGESSGTPLYMAPEKLLGRDFDEVRCDLYALGVTLFEASTLTRPFAVPEGLHKSCLATYMAGLEPPRPRSIRRGLSPRLEAIILKALDRDPNRRHAGITEFADTLDDFLTAMPTQRTCKRGIETMLMDLVRSLVPFCSW